MKNEIELKFTLPAASVRTLGRLPPVRAATHGRAVSRPVHSVYFDTPALDLNRERVSLRLRRQSGEWLQTLKSAPRLDGGLHLRQETDTPVPAAMLDHAALVDSGVSKVFADAHRLASLRPVFVTDFKRTIRALDLGDGRRAELAVDVGAIRVGDAVVPIHELEIELEAGEPADLVDFALALLEHVELCVEPRSKSARGYALLAAEGPSSHAPSTPALDVADDLPGACRSIVSACLRDLLEAGRGMQDGDDPEFLHQARIAIRRLRLAFATFGEALGTDGRGAAAAFDWLADDFGRARDWDVFVLETLPLIEADLGDHLDSLRLRAWAEGERAAADARAREAIGSKRYTRMVLELTRGLLRDEQEVRPVAEATLPTFTAANLAWRHKDVVRRGRVFADLDVRELHELRKDVKKLRYLAAIFGTLWPKKRVKPYVQSLERLQDILGGVNDAVVVERLLGEWRQAELGSADYEAIGLVRGWLIARMRDRLRRFPAAWSRFEDAKKFWRGSTN
jgi:inorganic triphosphatase YgiF